MARLSDLIQFTERPLSRGGIEFTAKLEWFYRFPMLPGDSADIREHVKREAVERCFKAFFGEMEEKLREARREILSNPALDYGVVDETFRKLREVLDSYR